MSFSLKIMLVIKIYRIKTAAAAAVILTCVVFMDFTRIRPFIVIIPAVSTPVPIACPETECPKIMIRHRVICAAPYIITGSAPFTRPDVIDVMGRIVIY